ncbi:type I polyketide synthase [Colwellia ponticola]|uniref:SDR family NAD(P)-dependent oxidoreductase n=1 Tax=Colwellia ponticola TaxID=2304625 RepID=A0A8H2JK93_9GAMM|nr:type I polyketide synthase [Colwellia ponticola]TMM44809.1 SDR family NAD(P)-dependent oxidoreductase [Colwellia ponticola]
MTKQQQPTSNNSVTNEVDEQQFTSRLQECPIAIIGMASIFADAKNLENYWDNIFDSVNSIKDVPKSQWNVDDYYDSDPTVKDKTYCKRGGFLPEIDFDPMEFGLPPNILELTDIAQLLSLVVAREVLNDAGIGDGSGYDRDKVGITLGIGGGQKQIGPLTSRLQGPVLEKVLKASGVDSEDRAMIIEKFKKAYIDWEENSFPGMLGNVIAGRIANRFDFGGTNCVVDAACASSLSAIKLAVSDLLEYRSEVMISGGVCCDNSPFMYMSFAKTPAFTTNDDIRPFDVDSKGMMIGEGIGMMAFKRLEDAERDGDKIYAVLKGIGTSSDGRFKSIYAPRPDGQAKALKRAYDDAGFEPKSCCLIEAHGTGTKAGDAAEFSGLLKHFSHNNEATQHIALGSVKSQIGHTKAAAGAAGMMKAVLALHHKVLPATININTPNPALDIENSPLYLNSETRPWMPRADGSPRRAGISSFGFGGTNFHMVLEEYNSKALGKYRLNTVPQTLLFAAKDESALVTLLTNWQNKLKVNTEEQVFVFNALVTEHQLKTPAANQARCGFVAKNADEALALINVALKQFASNSTKDNANSEAWSVPAGLYYRQSALATKGKVVALFSGQGSQYVNMGRELACNFPTVMQAASDMDTQFSQAGLAQLSSTSYPIPVFNADARKVQDDALRLTQHAQPAIGALSVGLYKTFIDAGFKADFTAGHSFGELTALWAAGVLSEQDYMMLARSRGQAMAAPNTDGNGDESNDFDAGTMVAVVGDPEKVAAVIKDISDISIANYNSNNQVVVAGVTGQIAIATEALKAQGYNVVPLPVSAAFHTPLVAHAQKPFAQAIDCAKFTAPSIPVFANGTGKVYSNKAADIKKALKNHMLESVHFNKEIDNIYADGGRIFVEFGPKNVLTKLVDNILQDKDDVVTIAVNANAKQSSDKQLRQAALQLAVLGVSLEDIDPYNGVKRPLTAVKMSPLAMKLTGKSYVSAKTEKAFADALTDGRVIKQAKATSSAGTAAEHTVEKIVEKVVEKIVEVERIVEVEKIVYLNADGTIADASTVQPTNVLSASQQPSNNIGDIGNVNNSVAADIERSVSQFVEHQQQLLNVHEQYMQGPKAYAATVAKVLDTVANKHVDGALPESVERTLNMYHDFQTQTLRVHEQYLHNQSDNMSTMLSGKAQPETSTPVVQQKAAPVTPPLVEQITEQAAESVTLSKPAAVATVTATVVPAPTVDLAHIQTVMMDVVADKTGYPTQMLELGMDMEADLGIDSIKRVEILGAVQEIITDLPELNPEDLAELRTLGEIVTYLQSSMQGKVQSEVTAVPLTQASTTAEVLVAPVAIDHIQNVMMEVVADKTGYPPEMLELGMDMEADLGIDSIKRVEILGAVQEIITDLPELNPEDLAELRTLGEIVTYLHSHMQSKVTATPSTHVVVKTEAPVPPVAIDVDRIQNVMMDVVADKTGYPPEMLELGMDMEADLGIDSIKRVEILGAVQEIITDLPELNPEDLAELRTLGEIVSHMQSKVQSQVTVAPTTPAVVASAVVTETPVPSVAIDLAHIQTVMMDVVADKTGYPTQMLELGMDMEADLGIDSIKRVEILGAVQEIITDLPELNPEDLAELRTLGEIVSHMQDKVQSQVAPVPPTPTSPPAKDTTSKEISAAEMSSTSTAIENPAPSATVALQALSSVTKIIQDFSALGKDQAKPNALIVDDGSGVAVAVSSTLVKTGWQVTVLKPNWLDENSKKAFGKTINLIDIGSKDHTVDEEQVKQLLEKHAQLDAVIYLQAKNHASAHNRSIDKIDSIEYSQAAKQGLMLAFVLAKYCQVKSANVARASFVVVTRQGGTLGYSNSVNSDNAQEVNADLQADLVQGGLGGLVKTLSHEWNGVCANDGGVFCRVIDLSVKLAADKAATLIVDELHDVNTSLIEVAHDTDNLSNNLGTRLTLVGVKTDSYALEQSTSLDGANTIDSQAVFLVSGGAKGVTAHCVIEIAKQHQAKFILLGRSPLLAGEDKGGDQSEESPTEPSWANGHHDEAALKKAAMQVLIASGEKPTPVKVTQFVRPILANREIVQTLNAIKAAGGQAQYVAADVTNSQSVRDAVAPALVALAGTSAEPLTITGIIHGAGVLADQFIEQKTLAEFEAVYRTKIDGLLSLLSVCQPENIKHLVLFSSAAGFYGNPGQSDYSMANDILNKTAYRFKAKHPNAQVLSFNWGPWDGGMVTPELKRMFNARGVYIIPLDAGASLLVRELSANTNRCAQILVGNDLSSSSASQSKAAQAEPESSLKKSPVSCLSINSSKVARVIKTLQATNNIFLADHVIGNDHVLPTVCAIAWMSEAALSVYPDYVYQGINNYKLLKGVTFDETTLAKQESKDFFIDMTVDMSVDLHTQVLDGGDTLLIDSKISSINEAGKIVFHYSGQVVLASQMTAPIEDDNLVGKDLAAKLTATTASEAKALYQNGTLFHGESLQGITHLIECDEQGLLLACKVPEVAQQKQGDFAIPGVSSGTLSAEKHNIFANDLAYQAMLVWVKRELGLGSLPSSTQAWHVYGQVALGQPFYLQLTVVQSSGKGGKRGKLVADINFISEEGLLLAEMKTAKVTASDSLNDMFLPTRAATSKASNNAVARDVKVVKEKTAGTVN